LEDESGMNDFPHHYAVTATAAVGSDVRLNAERLPELISDSPAEFDGPGDRWSPETLLVGAVGDCLVLTFKAVAAASQLPWTAIQCSVTGTLDRIERVTQFTRFDVHVDLEVPKGTNFERARRVLEKAERNCLITNSLKATTTIVPTIWEASQPSRALSPA
jgi:organic hydroperoxide reductase OsmC/OhrA